MNGPDYSKRGYLLPIGCKDLMDVIKLQAAQKPYFPGQQESALSNLPPIQGQIVVSEKTTVGELAGLLGQNPYRIVADVMELGVFANVKQFLHFEVICKVARKYGYKARSPA